ncbi:MAG: polyphenol oxidase family protein [Gemmatimonadaceae bacterium]
MTALAAEVVEDFAPYGVRAFTTGRNAGSFSTASAEPVRDVMARWDTLRAELRSGGPRLATARQVHGTRVLVHGTGWEGWLRADEADGHAAVERGTAMAVSIADCVPIFVVHPSGACALLHSGWRGTAGRIVERGIAALTLRRRPAAELRVHLGPAICGRCYEVSPDVHERLTGSRPARATPVDLRAVIADQVRAMGVRHVTVSAACTRCHNERFFSHRAGDDGRQLGVLIADC